MRVLEFRFYSDGARDAGLGFQSLGSCGALRMSQGPLAGWKEQDSMSMLVQVNQDGGAGSATLWVKQGSGVWDGRVAPVSYSRSGNEAVGRGREGDCEES